MFFFIIRNQHIVKVNLFIVQVFGLSVNKVNAISREGYSFSRE